MMQSPNVDNRYPPCFIWLGLAAKCQEDGGHPLHRLAPNQMDRVSSIGTDAIFQPHRTVNAKLIGIVLVD